MSGDSFTNSILAGVGALIRLYIKSPNYVPGVSGWSINKDGSAEFSGALIRGEFDLGPGSPSPRVAINPNIPAVLANWDVANVTFNVVFLWYYNATDFYWQGIGTFFGTKVFMEGTYDTNNGPYMIRRVLQPGVGNVTERLGSYFLNSFALTLTTQQTALQVGDGSNISDSLTVNGPMSDVPIAGANVTAITSPIATTSGATELDLAKLALTANMVTGKYYRVTCMIPFTKTTATDQFAINVRTNTAVTGTLVCSTGTVDAFNNQASGVRDITFVFKASANWTGVFISVVRQSGAGTLSYYGRQAAGSARIFSFLAEMGATTWTDVA